MSSRALAPIVLLAGVALGACTSAYESTGIGLASVCAITDDCTFAAKCDKGYIGEVKFDATLARQLWLPIQVNNDLPNNADEASLRLNTNDAHITSFEMTYTGFPLAAASVGVNYLVPAGGSATAGVYVVPRQAALLAPPGAPVQAVAYVKAKGYLTDGSSFETGDFPVAFTFCNGCVASTYQCVLPEVPTATCPPDSLGTEPAGSVCAAP